VHWTAVGGVFSIEWCMQGKGMLETWLWHVPPAWVEARDEGELPALPLQVIKMCRQSGLDICFDAEESEEVGDHDWTLYLSEHRLGTCFLRARWQTKCLSRRWILPSQLACPTELIAISLETTDQ